MYKNILFAVEFSELAFSVGKKVKEISESFHAKLHLIHVVELPAVDIFPDIPHKEKLYSNEANNRLIGLGKSLQIAAENLHIQVGNPRVEIPEFVAKHKIDLLIVGHHERKGIDRLLGSTTYALLERVKCAVLVVPYST